eukprot:Lankesteria_metandrocarpae@DN665_c0_g1_i1.p2
MPLKSSFSVTLLSLACDVGYYKESVLRSEMERMKILIAKMATEAAEAAAYLADSESRRAVAEAAAAAAIDQMNASMAMVDDGDPATQTVKEVQLEDSWKLLELLYTKGAAERARATASEAERMMYLKGAQKHSKMYNLLIKDDDHLAAMWERTAIQAAVTGISNRTTLVAMEESIVGLNSEKVTSLMAMQNRLKRVDGKPVEQSCVAGYLLYAALQKDHGKQMKRIREKNNLAYAELIARARQLRKEAEAEVQCEVDRFGEICPLTPADMAMRAANVAALYKAESAGAGKVKIVGPLSDLQLSEAMTSKGAEGLVSAIACAMHFCKRSAT